MYDVVTCHHIHALDNWSLTSCGLKSLVLGVAIELLNICSWDQLIGVYWRSDCRIVWSLLLDWLIPPSFCGTHLLPLMTDVPSRHGKGWVNFDAFCDLRGGTHSYPRKIHSSFFINSQKETQRCWRFLKSWSIWTWLTSCLNAFFAFRSLPHYLDTLE